MTRLCLGLMVLVAGCAGAASDRSGGDRGGHGDEVATCLRAGEIPSCAGCEALVPAEEPCETASSAEAIAVIGERLAEALYRGHREGPEEGPCEVSVSRAFPVDPPWIFVNARRSARGVDALDFFASTRSHSVEIYQLPGALHAQAFGSDGRDAPGTGTRFELDLELGDDGSPAAVVIRQQRYDTGDTLSGSAAVESFGCFGLEPVLPEPPEAE